MRHADDLGPEAFATVTDVRLNARGDKAAVLLASPEHGGDSCRVLLRAASPTATSYAGAAAAAGTTLDDLAGVVSSVAWLADGEHVAYARAGAASVGAPSEVWLHRVGAPAAHDRQLYEEARLAARPPHLGACGWRRCCMRPAAAVEGRLRSRS